MFRHAKQDVIGEFVAPSSVHLEWLRCTSSEVMNGLLGEIVRTLSEDSLRKLTIKRLEDRNSIDTGPLTALAEQHSSHLESLVIDGVSLRTRPETRSAMLQMAGQICMTSHCLIDLVIKDTNTSSEEGDNFLRTVRDSEQVTLKQIDFTGGFNYERGNYEHTWFNGRQESIDLLLEILAKQQNLDYLKLQKCDLSID